MPSGLLAGGVYAVTQGSGPPSINDTLAANLTRQAWAQAVSPEILAVGTIAGDPLLVRGVEPAAFFAVEPGTWIDGRAGNGTWAAAGVGLAGRLSLRVGAEVSLVGSSTPRIAVAPVTGVYRTDGPADDELLVDLDLARFLTGVPAGSYHSIRVRTSDPVALLAFLAESGASVRVSGPSGPVGGANSAPATDPRLINLYLLHGEGTLPADYLAEGINEATNAARVVAWGLAALILALLACGIHAAQARAFAERRPTVGVLRAMGASHAWIAGRSIRETLPWSLAAGLVGGGTGLAVVAYLGPRFSAVIAGHAVRVTPDVGMIAILVLGVAALSIASQLLLLRAALRDRPGEVLRDEAATETPVSLEVVLRG